MITGANISACQKYRYALWRIWDDIAPVMAFTMLNPSTADAAADDATIRKCMKYAQREKHGGIHVTNVFAYRATDPKELRCVEDPVGPENYEYLMSAKRLPARVTVVAAWGNPVGGRRLSLFYAQARAAVLAQRAKCLGMNKDGSPKHPLYVRDNEPLVPWAPTQGAA